MDWRDKLSGLKSELPQVEETPAADTPAETAPTQTPTEEKKKE